jgi:PAS domain S-box-containing protein
MATQAPVPEPGGGVADAPATRQTPLSVLPRKLAETQAGEPLPQVALRWPKAVMTVTGSLSLAASVLVLIGWHTGHILSFFLLLDSAPVRYNGALCLAFLGTSVLLLAWRRIAWARLSAAPAAVVSLVTLCEYLLGRNLGIDELFFQSTRLVPLLPARIPPNMALCYTLLSGALLLAAKTARALRNTVQVVLAALAAALGLVGFIGYLADIPRAYSWGKSAPLAMPAALAIVALGLGVVAFVRQQHARRSAAIPPWSPLLAGLTLATVSAALWRAMHVLHPQSEVAPYVLLAGLLQAAFLYLVLHLLRTARERARQLRQLNSVLQIQMRSLERAERELQEIQAYTRSLIEASLDPLVTISPDGKITDVNAATEAATGFSRQELIGTDFSDYFTEPATARAGYQQVFLEGVVHNYELGIRHRDGHVMPVLYNASVYHDRAGAVTGVFAAARDITERKRAEEELRNSEECYRALVLASSQIVWTTDPQGQVVDDLPLWREFTGLTREEMLGRGWLNSLHADDRERTAAAWSQAVEKRCLYEVEYRVRRRDGDYRDMAVRGAPVLRADGSLREWVGTCTDITERKRAEEALRRSEAYLQLQFERMPIGCIVWSRDFRVQSWNPAAEKIFGFSAHEAVGRHPYGLIVPQAAEAQVEAVYRRLVEGDVTAHIENENLTKQGRSIICSWTNTPLKGPDGDVVGILSMVQDITSRKQGEEELHEQAALLNLAHDAILVRDLEDKVVFWNRGAEETCGWTWKEAAGRVSHELLHTKFPKPLSEIMAGVRQLGEWEGELQLVTRDGRTIVVASRWSLQRAQDGAPVKILEINRDITERKRLEAELRARQAYTRSLIEASLDPLVTIATDGRITDVNRATEEVTGMERGQLVGSDFCDYFTEPDKARAGYQQVFAEGLVQEYPLAIRHCSGRVTEVVYNASVYRNQAGEVEGVFAAARDITERKRLEESLRRRTLELENSVAELEAFSYSVSHDLRAPLRSIDGFSQILLEDYRDKVDQEAQDSLRRIRNASQNMAQLIDALLQLSRVMRIELRREPVDLSVLALSTAAMIQKADPERRVRFHVANGLQAQGDRRLLGVLLQNLLQNAWKFSARNAEPTVEFGSTQIHGKTAYYVRDNGIGFDMTYVNKLFTPFQRLHAKEQFEGTGIGLATVQRIIKRHGGKVWAEGAVGKGATFYFSLD